jgi:hypothetical protein
MKRRLFLALLASAVGTAGAADAEDLEYIGTATMAPDGTITLWLRAELPVGGHGHSTFVVTPNDPQYREILRHLGGLRPGEIEPVRPWPGTPAHR